MPKNTSESKHDRAIIGPVFQPDDLIPSTGIGPVIPANLYKQKLNKTSESVTCISPTGFDDEIDTIGPLLPGQEIREEWRHLKSGSSEISSPMVVNNEKLKRDAWMTELLPKTNDLNSLKPRKFRQDLSTHSHHDPSWFTAPTASKEYSNRHASNNQINQSMTDNLQSQRNKISDYNMAKIASKYQSSKQKSSLLELHERKLKKHKLKKHKEKSKKHKSKKHKKGHRGSSSSSSSSSPSEPIRRPFDRDKDLKISRIDTAARKAIIEHSKKLTCRFSHGSQQYL